MPSYVSICWKEGKKVQHHYQNTLGRENEKKCTIIIILKRFLIHCTRQHHQNLTSMYINFELVPIHYNFLEIISLCLSMARCQTETLNELFVNIGYAGHVLGWVACWSVCLHYKISLLGFSQTYSCYERDKWHNGLDILL